MTEVTLPFLLLRLSLRVEFVQVPFRTTNRVASRPTRVELKKALRRELSPHLLRDVGLDDSRTA
jgi:hypothetical protein